METIANKFRRPIRTSLFIATYGRVFSGSKRLLIYHAPNISIAGAIAEDFRQMGENIEQVNYAEDVSDYPIEYKELTYLGKIDYDAVKTKKRRRIHVKTGNRK